MTVVTPSVSLISKAAARKFKGCKPTINHDKGIWLVVLELADGTKLAFRDSTAGGIVAQFKAAK